MNARAGSETLSITSRGTRCAAWLTLPDGLGPHPGLVLCHGLGATHDMMLAQYEQHFAHWGIATLAFDYRHTGESDGMPRQRFSMRGHEQDVAAALDFLQRHDSIDPKRVGLWGTSLGGMHALRVAAERPDVAAVVVQCPIVHGPAAIRTSGVWPTLRLASPIVDDTLRWLRGAARRYVPIVGLPGTTAAVTVSGALDGWYSTVPQGCAFDNRIAAADVVGLAVVSAKRRAANIQAPLLVCVSQRETLMDPRHAEDVAAAAPRGVARYYDADHFGIYHPPLLTELLADETAFLREHLGA